MLKTILAHAVFVLSGMYLTFFLIDRVNPAMNFINNGITKALLLLLCLCAVILALFAAAERRARTRRIARNKRPRY